MDIKAAKPASSVATSPVDAGRVAVAGAGSGNDLPPPPARLDAAVLADLSARKAALAQQMSRFLNANARDLEFQVDAGSGHAVVTVRDGTGNVVRTIPAETAMEMLRNASVESGTFVDSLV